MKIYNTTQNSGAVMHFVDQNLKIETDEQIKHRKIMNERCVNTYSDKKHI